MMFDKEMYNNLLTCSLAQIVLITVIRRAPKIPPKTPNEFIISFGAGVFPYRVKLLARYLMITVTRSLSLPRNLFIY